MQNNWRSSVGGTLSRKAFFESRRIWSPYAKDWELPINAYTLAPYGWFLLSLAAGEQTYMSVSILHSNTPCKFRFLYLDVLTKFGLHYLKLKALHLYFARLDVACIKHYYPALHNREVRRSYGLHRDFPISTSFVSSRAVIRTFHPHMSNRKDVRWPSFPKCRSERER